MQGGMGLVAGAALQMTMQLQSLEAAQRLCDSMLAIPSPGGSFFQAAISIELAGMPFVTHSVPRIQRLFEVSPLLLLEKPLHVLDLKAQHKHTAVLLGGTVISVHVHKC